MKRRYILIHSSTLTPATPIYLVWLGENKPDRILKQKLLTLSATDSDWFFKPYDWQACEFIQNIATCFGLFLSQLNLRSVTPSQIKTSCLLHT